jgi:hypothetical protein
MLEYLTNIKQNILTSKVFLLLVNKLLNRILKNNQNIYQQKIYHVLVPLLICLANLEKKLFKGSNMQAKHKAYFICRKSEFILCLQGR